MNYNFIVIEGSIGAGKTSLASKIAEEYNAKLILEEFADNPFLPKFYKNPEKYAFTLEMSFLTERYHQLRKETQTRDLFKTFTISDYFFMKSLIFAKSNLDNEEYKLYRRVFNIIYQSLPKPDLYVYLHKDVDCLLKNIARRGREYEASISPAYLEKIQLGYFDFFKQYPDNRFLIIDTNKMDYVGCDNDYKTIKAHIFNNKYPKGINRIN